MSYGVQISATQTVLGKEQLYINDNKCVKLTEQLVLKPNHRTRQKNEKLRYGKGGGSGVEASI
jgi:hypothetical protein